MPEGLCSKKIFDAMDVVDTSSTSSVSDSWTDRENELRKITKNKSRNKFERDESPIIEATKRGKKGRKKKRVESSGSESDTSIESRVATFRKSLSLRRRRAGSSDSGHASSYDQGRRSSHKSSHSPHHKRSRESGSTDASPVPSTRPGASHVKLPSFLKQPLPRGTDAPVILRDDPRLHKRKKSGWESVADALNARDNARDGIKEGDNDTAAPRLLGRTLFALRGFGCFDLVWGIGSYGRNFTELIRRIGSGNAEDLRVHQVKCKMTNRIAIGFLTLKMGSKKLGYEDSKSLLSGDFHQAPNAEIEDHFLSDSKAEKRPDQPKTAEAFRRCAENQTNLWCLFFGEQYRDERETCLANLLALHDDTPELFSVEFLIATWEAFIYDYIDRTFEGMRRLSQFCRSSDDISEIRRLALAKRHQGGII